MRGRMDLKDDGELHGSGYFMCVVGMEGNM